MLLKRVYEKNESGNLIYRNEIGDVLIRIIDNDDITSFKNLNGVVVCNYKQPPIGFDPTIIGIQVKRLPINGNQKFTPKLVEAGTKQNWLEKTDTHINITDFFTKEVHSFKIEKVAGRFCLHCGEKLEDDQTGQKARDHVLEKHDGRSTSVKGDNCGYYCDNFYKTVLEN